MKFICIGVCGSSVRTSESVDDLGLQERLTSAVAVRHKFKCLQISHAVALLCICTHTYIHTCQVNQHRNKYDSGTRKEVDNTSANPIIAAKERAHDGISIFFTKSFCGNCKQVCKHLKNNVSMYVCVVV